MKQLKSLFHSVLGAVIMLSLIAATLFLMVDMDDANHPVIKVRTWQPEKDPDFGLYGPGDFN